MVVVECLVDTDVVVLGDKGPVDGLSLCEVGVV